MSNALFWVGSVCGLISAALWWISSWSSIGITKVKDIKDAPGDDGDFAFAVDGEVLVHRIGRVSKLNAAAACLAGLAIAMQSIASLVSES